MKTIQSIPTDVYALFQPDVHHTVSEENLEAFGENVKQLVRDRLATRPDSDALRFSSLGKPDRQLWYQANTPDAAEPMPPKNYLKFLYGDVIEQLMILLIKEAGHTVEMEQYELELDGVLGHIDAKIDGVICDVKSASPFSYQKFANKKIFEDDPFGYIGQISGYSNVLTPERGGAFVAFDKVSGELCVLEIPLEISRRHSPSEKIAHQKRIINLPVPPDRCYSDIEDGKSGNRKLGTNCSYCNYKNSCWENLRTFFYASGPRFLTHVAKVPDVPELGKVASIEDKEVHPF